MGSSGVPADLTELLHVLRLALRTQDALRELAIRTPVLLCPRFRLLDLPESSGLSSRATFDDLPLELQVVQEVLVAHVGRDGVVDGGDVAARLQQERHLAEQFSFDLRLALGELAFVEAASRARDVPYCLRIFTASMPAACSSGQRWLKRAGFQVARNREHAAV